jgi:hypothetical protein
MTFYHRNKIYIPEAWTGEQALAVFEFLEEISAAVWDVHEKAILKAMNIKDPTLRSLDQAAQPESDIPF